MLTDKEASYRKQIMRVGIAMLIFLGCSFIVRYAYVLADFLTDDMRAIPRTVLLSLIEAVLYSSMFLVPAFVLKKLLNNLPHQPIDTSFKMPRTFPFYLFFTVGIVFAAGELNALIVSLFDGFSSAGGGQTALPTQNFEIILMVITTAVIPAFVEEYLFRGVVLGAMRPFGRTSAVVVSAFCFALMHGNVAQLLYTFVAGLVLGYVYCELKSLWSVVIIHFCNNFISIVQTIFLERMAYDTGIAAVYLLKLTVTLLGVVGIVYLVLHSKDQKRDLFENGCFERDVAPDPEFAQMEISRARRLRLFMAPTMVVFVVLSALSMLGLLLFL